ncbi:PREDICTED: anionic trypsin-like isoform X2 [Drosophila arizonae]|uniref:Anionic trypsin-like isoform X2 n=1 Tax=Drosophila arizonae TaxID=7263 RepID=A0ABM1Q378_DROAR|nr:PREDICTED: anionic trypsin-like isoform X2 [Drosophila arizonae]
MFVSQALPIGFLLLAAGVAAAAATEDDDQQRGTTVETHAKIIGGYPITIADAPYMVSIRARYYHEASFGEGHMCGGSVISQRVVCSAAHCFEMWK